MARHSNFSGACYTPEVGRGPPGCAYVGCQWGRGPPAEQAESAAHLRQLTRSVARLAVGP